MTVSEAILSNPGLEDVSKALLEKTLIVRSLVGTDEFSADLNTKVNLATADLYVAVVNSPDFSEGSLSIKQSRNYMISTAIRLYRENGEPDKASSLTKKITVTGKSVNRW
jgi:hypothetical protein